MQPNRFRRYLHQGTTAGLCAGVALGLAEAAAVLAASAPPRDLSVLPYAAVTYGVACAFAGLLLGAGLGLGGRLTRRAPAEPLRVFAFVGAALFAGLGLVIARFRVLRDVYLENLSVTSAKGLAVQGALLAAAVVVFVLGRAAARVAIARTPARILLRPWGGPAVFGLVAAAGVALAQLGAPLEATADGHRRGRGDDKPNVLVVVVDTLRADRLGAYGHDGATSPSFDALARDGVRFDHAFAQASWTRPSFASILTGRMPSSHRTMYKPDVLPDAVVTMAESLREEGYCTAGFVTNFNVAPYFNFGQGFDEYHYLEPELVLWANDTASRLTLYSIVRLVSERFVSSRLRVENYYQDARSVGTAVDAWLDRRPRDVPFFLFVGYMDPHDPYFAHPYDGTAIARVANPRPPLAMAERMLGLYDGEIRYWDEHFGRLVQGLKRRGLYDDTLIVVTADHGEEFGDHGGFWHGTTLYDEQVRVPLVLRLPSGEASGTTSADWVRHVDIMPTILRFAGARPVEGVQGTDLFTAGRRPVFAEEDHEGNRLMSIRVPGEDGTDYKLIVANPGNPRGLPPSELFDVARDPAERRDLSARDRDRLTALRGTLEDAARASARGAVEAQQHALDAAASERLRALGYAGDGDERRKRR